MNEADATEITDQVEDTEEVHGEDAGGPKQLREALKSTKAENRKLRTMLLNDAFEKTGLDPEKGLGKAIAKEYKGEPTAEDLLAYAKEEYGYEPGTPSENPANVIHQSQAKVDQVQQFSTSTVPLSEDDALAQAERERDLVTAGNIKAAKLRRMMERKV